MDTQTVKYLANLGFLSFDENELEKLAEEMNGIIESVSFVKDYNAEYDPLNDNLGAHLDDLREDKAEPDYPTDKLMRNAVHSENCFVVPKVME